MEANELRLIAASNIIRLRTSAGLTQAALGEKLNYSDKSVSKWERGDAIPDAYVLKQMSEIFNVSVDYILSSHDDWTPPEPEKETLDIKEFSPDMTIAVVLLGILTATVTAFVTVWLALDKIWWWIFMVGLSIAVLTYLILDCIFHRAKYLPYTLPVFILSLFCLLYFLLNHLMTQAPWQVFLIAVPAAAIGVLSTKINKSRNRKRRKKPENQ